jgi:hypothetical protein
MCRACVEKYYEIMIDDEKRRALKRPWWDVMSDEEMLATLPKITAVADQVDDFLREWVRVVRARDLSWAEVGRVMGGVSRQAAWERFSKYTRDAN